MEATYTAAQRDFLLKEVAAIQQRKLDEINRQQHDDPLLNVSDAAYAAKQEFIAKNPKLVQQAMQKFITERDASGYNSFNATSIEISVDHASVATFLRSRYDTFKKQTTARTQRYDERRALVETTVNTVRRGIMFSDTKVVETVLKKLQDIPTTI